MEVAFIAGGEGMAGHRLRATAFTTCADTSSQLGAPGGTRAAAGTKPDHLPDGGASRAVAAHAVRGRASVGPPVPKSSARAEVGRMVSG